MERPGDMLMRLLAEHGDADAVAQALAEQPQSLYLGWREHMRQHELRALDRFGEVFALLEALQVACLSVGAMFDQEHCGSAREQREPRVNVLRQLWAASVRAGGEAVVLLRGGYADGALARWRLVREAEVLSLFLMEQPVEVAADYLQHTSFKVVSLKGDIQRWARWSGGEPLSDQEMREMGREVGDTLAQRPEWRGDYGWAHEPLLASDGDYRRTHERQPRLRGPSFADLEQAVGQRPSKLWWSWSSRAVHVTLDTTGDIELAPSGPVEELGTPAARLAESLALPTAMLVCSWPEPPNPVEPYGTFARTLIELGSIASQRLGDIEGTPAPE